MLGAFRGWQRGLPREERAARSPLCLAEGQQSPGLGRWRQCGEPLPSAGGGGSLSPQERSPPDRPPLLPRGSGTPGRVSSLCGLRACAPPTRTGRGLLCRQGPACATPSHTPCMSWAGVPALTGKTSQPGGQAPQGSDKKHETPGRKHLGQTAQERVGPGDQLHGWGHGEGAGGEGWPRGTGCMGGDMERGQAEEGGPSSGAVPRPLAGSGMRSRRAWALTREPEMPWSQAWAGSWHRGRRAVSGATVTAPLAWRSDSRDCPLSSGRQSANPVSSGQPRPPLP